MQQDLNCICSFAQVASAGSFRQAAKELNIPLSTLSNRVARLEESIGVTLLNRSTRTVCLTEVGQSYLTSVSPALEALASAAKSAQDKLEEPTGKLRVSVPIEFGECYMGSIISTFKKNCPLVDVDCQLTNRRVHLLEEGFDVVIRAGKLEDSALVCKAVGEPQGMITCASAKYIEKNGTPMLPSDLGKHTCLLMSGARNPEYWNFLVNKTKKSIRIESSVLVNSYSVLVDLAVENMGIIHIPRFIAAQAIKSEKLQQILSEYVQPPIKFHALFMQSSRMSPKLRIFLETVENALLGDGK